MFQFQNVLYETETDQIVFNGKHKYFILKRFGNLSTRHFSVLQRLTISKDYK